MKARDQEVRAHEEAHAAAAGPHGGSPSYTFEEGPDGKQYAVGGEVPIRLTKGRTPEETIANAQQVRAAANAPAEPSGQDRKVAAMASQMEAEARAELTAQKAEQAKAEVGESSAPKGAGDAYGSGGVGPSGTSASSDPLMSLLALDRERSQTPPGGGYGLAQKVARYQAA